ncbi:MAG TPA: ABC transporter permease [Candidatus Acidoferrales bacterium]|jgi:predicted permease|nr:ABC transporter permease [Candidatus Acidoferrales bacterium]
MLVKRFRSWLRATLQRRVVEREMDDELRFHVERYAEDLKRGGMERGEAERQARLEFGSVGQTKEACREARGADLLDSLLSDIHYGLRRLRSTPGFAGLAVVTLALGIGATTAVFSLVNAVLLRDLPYRDSERLVFLYEPIPGIPDVPLEAFGPVNGDFFTWQKQSRSFESMAMFTNNGLNASLGDAAFRATGSRVTGDFFRVLGVSPALGRTPDDADTQPGHERVVVISQPFWQSRFAGDRNVLGREMLLNARPYRIIGVMPAGFAFPHGTESLETTGKTTEIWVPWTMTPEQRASRDDNPGNAIGRLRPGVSLSQAQVEIAAISSRFDPPFQQQNRKPQGVVRPFDEEITGGSRRALLIFMAAVLLVLVIACSNVAGLGLARASGRAREISIRAALGASRLRLVRQLLAESLCVALAGGVLGMAAAFWIVRLLVDFHPANIPRIEETSIDGRVLLFTICVSLATAVFSGLFPAWSGSRCNLNETIKGSGARSVRSGASRLHSWLIVAEMALTIVLLIGSGLLIHSFLRLRSVDKGFASFRTVTMGLQLDGRYNSPQRQNEFFHTLVARVRAVPGVQEAAAVDHVPLGGGESISLIEVEGNPFDEKTSFESRSVTPRYFAAMGIPLLAGRAFDDGDAAGRTPVIIVSRSFERRYFPGRTALGKRVHATGWRTIVGVVADVRMRELDTTPPMQFYSPLWQTPTGSAVVVVRGTLPLERTASALRGLVRNMDAALAVADVRTMEQLISEASAERRFQTLVLTVFGGISLFLSLLGLYALMAYSVQRRTAEIGIRMALGAQPSAVMGLVLRQGATLWLGGIALGFVCAWSVTRWMRSLLFEVQPTDPLTFVGVAALFCAVAAMACYVPARRATRVDPVISLRYE